MFENHSEKSSFTAEVQMRHFGWFLNTVFLAKLRLKSPFCKYTWMGLGLGNLAPVFPPPFPARKARRSLEAVYVLPHGKTLNSIWYSISIWASAYLLCEKMRCKVDKTVIQETLRGPFEIVSYFMRPFSNTVLLTHCPPRGWWHQSAIHYWSVRQLPKAGNFRLN